MRRAVSDATACVRATLAPSFSLPTVDGRNVALADYADRRVLLVFSDPECGPCMELLPRLDAAARVTDVPVLVISRGSVDANRRKLAEARSRLTVALQAHWEISRLYAKFATPIAYLVDEQGRIASEVAVGGAAILSLVSVSGPDSRLATPARTSAGQPPDALRIAMDAWLDNLAKDSANGLSRRQIFGRVAGGFGVAVLAVFGVAAACERLREAVRGVLQEQLPARRRRLRRVCIVLSPGPGDLRSYRLSAVSWERNAALRFPVPRLRP